MNRLLSILLIPFFVLGQALPHSHAGSGVLEPDDHAARPHVHLSGGHSHVHDGNDHDHNHVDQVRSPDAVHSTHVVFLTRLVAHDSDACYFAQSANTFGRVSTIEPLDFASAETLVETLADRPVSSRLSCSRQTPDSFARLPIYLLVASLRL